jgi:hypothetical protein
LIDDNTSDLIGYRDDDNGTKMRVHVVVTRYFCLLLLGIGELGAIYEDKIHPTTSIVSLEDLLVSILLFIGLLWAEFKAIQSIWKRASK